MMEVSKVTIRRRVTAIETALIAVGITLAIGAANGILRKWRLAVAPGLVDSLKYVLVYRMVWRFLWKETHRNPSKTNGPLSRVLVWPPRSLSPVRSVERRATYNRA